MKKLLILTIAIASITLSKAQSVDIRRSDQTGLVYAKADNENIIIGDPIGSNQGITLFADSGFWQSGSITFDNSWFFNRVLTEEERDSLVNDIDFRKKCEWAISDYASYWIQHDGSNLDANGRAKWRREYQFVKAIWRSDYNDPMLAKRFVTLAKGMQFNLDNTPTVREIVAQFVANNSFDELSSLYFDMLTQ